MELIRRAQALGATDEQLNRSVAVEDGSVNDSLVALVRSLEPPPSASATVADITVGRDASIEDVLMRLHTIGAVVIKDACSPELLQQVDAELGSAGAWSREWSGLEGGRMGMDAIMAAPSVEQLLTSDVVLTAVNGLLGPSCRRIALKELEIFAIQPGQVSFSLSLSLSLCLCASVPLSLCVSMTLCDSLTRVLSDCPSISLSVSLRYLAVSGA